MIINSVEKATEYINNIPKFASTNTIEDTRRFLGFLGNPDKNFKIIHVAGTNGKGSVCAYIDSILRELNFSVGLFTSPHLVDIRERFVINGEMVSEKEFLNAFNHILKKIEEYNMPYHPTYFEYMFFVCMILFKDRGIDYCILETGLGGRFDATNSVLNKELCVITRIGLDHTEWLGDTIPKIAAEKGGIMRKDVPTVFLNQSDEVYDAYLNIFRDINDFDTLTDSELENEYKNLVSRNIVGVSDCDIDNFTLKLNTIANYQRENATIALAAVKRLLMDGEHILTDVAISSAMQKCYWPGRMEEIADNVFLDGAHNDDGIRAFIETVSCDNQENRTLLFSVVKDKDYEKMVEKLINAKLFNKIVIAPLYTQRGLQLAELKRTFERVRPDMAPSFEFYNSVKEAFETVINKQLEDERIYIAGSLYLVGEVKEILKNM